jgi:hypothetical protein
MQALVGYLVKDLGNERGSESGVIKNLKLELVETK